MTDIAEYQEPEVVVHEDLSELARWAMDARQAHLVAQSLALTSFIPQSMRGKPGEITACILTGQEIGLKPMSALRSIDIIQGTPAMRANALRGLVQSRGHEVWVVESTETRAIVAGRRRGSEQEQRSTWTMDRARKMSLSNKDNWQKQPGAMLVARATAEVCRLIASDVILGMPYAVEELDSDAIAPNGPAVVKPRKTAQRRLEPATPPDEPELTEPEPKAEEPTGPATATIDPDEYDPTLEADWGKDK